MPTRNSRFNKKLPTTKSDYSEKLINKSTKTRTLTINTINTIATNATQKYLIPYIKDIYENKANVSKIIILIW